MGGSEPATPPVAGACLAEARPWSPLLAPCSLLPAPCSLSPARLALSAPCAAASPKVPLAIDI
ncbi:hypothetical protein EJ04DRAFT_513812 [Polyplosphaeria fusca]|uniref:Uncharacterized protein n=1 Tax=Polyplosphaeria fusca TaxID=682080 RepID=A0A9P4QX58_9PLEO|nr:hypothetical protein EJ04DRAFT_513812 [Polyplosphaeria fusca]